MGPVRLLPTTGPNTAGRLAAQAAAEGCELIAVLGGDGTLNEAAQGILGTQESLGTGATFAPLPGGTANVLCREMGLSANAVKAARQLREGATVERVAVGLAEWEGQRRYFLAMAGAGLDAAVVAAVNPALKRATGKFAYWVAGFQMAFRMLPGMETEALGPEALGPEGLEAAAVDAGGRRREASFFLFSRVRNYGGDLEIARRVHLLHAGLEMVSFRGRHALQYVPYLIAVLVRLPGWMPGITLQPVQGARCMAREGEAVLFHLDGELVGQLPATFSVQPQALPLLMPSRYVEWAKRHPWTT